MSANGLEVFDKTVETTNTWLKEIMADLRPDRHVAWHVLGSVLRNLRDRLPLGLAAHLGAQLPILVRGIYYDQFEPGALPSQRNSYEEFLIDVTAELADTHPVDPEVAIRSVFGVLSRHISEGQIRKIRDALPQSMREAWDSAMPFPSAEELLILQVEQEV